MKKEFVLALGEVKSLDEVRDALERVFAKVKNGRNSRLGYVSGIITSDGPNFIQQNLTKLDRYTDFLRQQQDFPVFSARDIFSDELFTRLNAYHLPPKDWEKFWREILSFGHVTDVFMTPRWESSRGATDEYDTAKKLGLRLHLVEGIF